MSKLSETPELHVSRNIFATLAKTNYWYSADSELRWHVFDFWPGRHF